MFFQRGWGGSQDGASFGSLCVPVPTTSPKKSGAAHGPRQPEFIDIGGQTVQFCVLVSVKLRFLLQLRKLWENEVYGVSVLQALVLVGVVHLGHL